MTARAKFIFMAALLLPCLSVSSVFAGGKGGKGKGGKSKPAVTVVEFEAKLNPVVADGNGEGEAEYKSKSSTRGTSESFKAEAEFAIPDANLGITDLNSTQTAQLELHLSRGGADYAVCALAIKEIEFKYKPTGVQIEAEFGVSVSQETAAGDTPELEEKVGSCVLAATGTNGVPTVAAGDTATVVSLVQSGTPPVPVSTQVLTGIFE